ncbi:MAG: hypothetical protein ABH828_01390 [archaeon]
MPIKKEDVLDEKETKPKNCIVCKEPAEFCMRGIPDNCYCKACAKDYFKLLSYLEKLK